MGISRLSTLMSKPIQYNDLQDLIDNYVSSYNSYFHWVQRIDLGLPFSHSCISETPLQWKVMKLTLENSMEKWDDYHDAFLQYSRDCIFIFDYFDKTGNLPKWCTQSYRQGNVTLKSRR